MTETPLDLAHAAMLRDEDDDPARLAFYERFAESELFLLLKEEARGEHVDADVFETSEGRFALAFDLEERLTSFSGKEAHYARVSGRTIARLLGGQTIGVGLNLDVAPSSTLIPSPVLVWMSALTNEDLPEASALPNQIDPPTGVPEILLSAIDRKLAAAEGLASAGYLVSATYSNGSSGSLLVIVGALPGAEAAFRESVREAVVFSGLDAGTLDLTFLSSEHPAMESLAKVGLRFDIPALSLPSPPAHDPDVPPRLK